MLRHRYLTVIAYLRGLLFCLHAKLWCRFFSAESVPRCYGWPLLRSTDGTLKLGKNVVLGNVKIILANGGYISIGDNSGINDGSVLGALERIEIGNRTAIAEYVMIRDHDHNYKEVLIGESPSGYVVDPVLIGNGCWLGFGVVVTKGVFIEDGSIVGASAVVTKSLKQGEVVVGNPAKCIKRREENSET